MTSDFMMLLELLLQNSLLDYHLLRQLFLFGYDRNLHNHITCLLMRFGQSFAVVEDSTRTFARFAPEMLKTDGFTLRKKVPRLRTFACFARETPKTDVLL